GGGVRRARQLRARRQHRGLPPGRRRDAGARRDLGDRRADPRNAFPPCPGSGYAARMSDLLADTRVEPVAGEPGCWRATLSPDWAVWGPNGGYLATIALRAAMAASRLPRPASFHCHFLATGAFAPVELRVQSLGGGKRAESLRVDMRQDERVLLAATAWMTDDGLAGFQHGSAGPAGPPAAPA